MGITMVIIWWYDNSNDHSDYGKMVLVMTKVNHIFFIVVIEMVIWYIWRNSDGNSVVVGGIW